MATELLENTIATLKVLRKSEQGAFLDGQTGNTSDDILLHNDQQTSAVAIGDEVGVFLYKDPKGRLTASMRLPAMKIGQIGYTEVINTTNFGCFVEVGTERGIFMPHAEMRGRPQIGEKVWVRLYTDKSSRLAVSMDVDDAMRRASKAADEAIVGQMVEGAIYNLTADGAFFITPERWIAFLHRSEMTHSLKVGEMVTARVTFKRDDGRINVSMRPTKEKALVSDGDIIMDYLMQRNGKMPYSDDSSVMLIKDKFNISKSAFKRTLGHLMKEKKITQQDGWTMMTDTGRAFMEEKRVFELAKAEEANEATPSAGSVVDVVESNELTSDLTNNK